MVVLGLKSGDLGRWPPPADHSGLASEPCIVKTARPNPQQITKRSAFVVNDVQGADFFRIKTPRESRGRVFSLVNMTDSERIHIVKYET